ncbi:hypothetical protein [Haloplanus halobius]|uniref:hypothetical protein n=1 Tax=Haloplanus halobius TaxID=2934938 RepID=UPI00200D2D1A|nr:hypothetical protein [Haloplanus sp. XH21]
MLRGALLLVIGVLEAIYPHRVVDFWLSLALDDDGEPRRWVYTAARIEGVLIVLWTVRRWRAD